MQTTYHGAAPRAATALCGLLLSILSPAAALAEDTPETYSVYSGYDIAPDSFYTYDGVIVALNHDMSKSGFLLRFTGGLSAYSYEAIDLGGKVDGDLWQFDIMPGYQIVDQSMTYALYVGFDYQNSQLSPDDPGTQVRGTETGFKVAGNIEFSDEKAPFEASILGEYSTAFSSYYAQARIGLKLCDKFYVGPEGALDGLVGYDAQRLGGFAKYTFDITERFPLTVTLAAGHQFVRGSGEGGAPDSGPTASGPGGGAGTYGSLDLSTSF
jgi:hypothetical protein